MDIIKDSVIECLNRFSGKNGRIISELDRIIEEHGEKTYTTIIHILAHLNLEPEHAKECWEKIILHRATLSKCLNREVNLQTAICDYFCSIDISLKNPKLVEISVFETKEKASRYDDLTGLLNRNHFEDSINQELARSNRYNYELSLLFFDIDDFKIVNDTYGHLAGDLVLKNVSRILMDGIRAEDVAVRYGGEELVVILPQTPKIKALVLGERLREKIRETPNIHNDQSIHVTVSGGLASFPADGKNTKELVEYADQGLYIAKSKGKNNISIFSKNKRRFKRIDFFTEVQVQHINDIHGSSKITANTKNVSQTGLLFESDIPFEMGDIIKLDIRLETFSGQTQLVGTVVRIEIYESDRYEIGVSFLEIDQAVETEISKFVNSYLIGS